MKLAVNISFPDDSYIVHDGKELDNNAQGWAQANHRALKIGNAAIALLESMELTAYKGYRIRKVPRERLWTAWRKGIRAYFIMISLID